ncbi:MAG: hypothetical protein ACKPEN_04130 [Planktothrix sp.]|jgi:hypothetical protein|uniref:hypothetical protein n=1 Tax=Planktothrix sp. TaxID=3088171 RepID=UPI0038D3C5B8
MSNNQSQESYLQVYQDLKDTIKYHRRMTFGGYIVFRGLQFLVPLLSALLTGLISMQIGQNQGFTNTDPIGANKVNTGTTEANKTATGTTEANKTGSGETGDNKAATGKPEDKADAEKDNTNIILTMSIILTVVGSLNSSLKPAESAEWAGKYSNKFEEFENDFNLSMIEIRTKSDATDADYIQLLKTVNHDLAKLIHERNQKQTSIFKAPVVPELEPEVVDEIPIVAANRKNLR